MLAISKSMTNRYGGSSQTLIQGHVTSQLRIVNVALYLGTRPPSHVVECQPVIRKINVKLLVGLCFSWALAPTCGARAEVYEGFESDKTQWRLVDHDCGEFRELQHRQSRRIFHTGGGSESIEFEAGHGTRINYRYGLEPIWLNYDIEVGIWVRATKPGVQLKMEVVLPNTLDASRQKPITLPVHGTVYERPGQWQHLTVTGALEKLQKRLPVFRSQYGAKFDLKGAYINALSLNVYSGRGRTIVWVDDLEIQGGIGVDETSHLFAGPGMKAVHRSEDGAADLSPPQVRGNQLVGRFSLTSLAQDSLPDPTTNNPTTNNSSKDNSSNDRSMFLRIVRHQGESLRWLKSVGFNAVLLDGQVTEAMNTEARELDLWLLAPPPQLYGERIEPATSSRVAVWWLGDDLAHADFPRVSALASRVRLDDPHRRAIGVGPRESVWQYSRLADILMFRFPGLGGDHELSQLCKWIENRQSQDFRRGVTFVEMPTGFAPEITRQLEQVGMEDAAAAPLSPEQVRVMAFRAVATGIRGLCFRSNSRLDETTSAATARAASVEWIQSELQIIDPWLAAGGVGEKSYMANDGYEIRSLKTDRSALLFLFTHRSLQQHVVGGLGESQRILAVPPQMGAPMAHQITSDGLRRIRVERRAGSREIVLPTDSHVALVVLTEDPLAMEHLARTSAPGRQHRAQLAFEVASRNAEHVELVHENVSGWLAPDYQIDRWLADVRANLAQARSMLESSQDDVAAASVYTLRAMNRLAQIRERDWRRTSAAFPRPVTTAAAAGFMTLPAHHMFRREISRGRWGTNQTPSGDMEDLRRLLDTGWQQHLAERGVTRAVASLNADSPRDGRNALQLEAVSTERGFSSTSTAKDDAYVRIVSPPILLRAGQIVQVKCAVQLLDVGDDSNARVMFRDSIGGEILQWSLTEPSADWTECLAYRIAPQDMEFRVEAILQGIGRARIDNVELRVLETP